MREELVRSGSVEYRLGFDRLKDGEFRIYVLEPSCKGLPAYELEATERARDSVGIYLQLPKPAMNYRDALWAAEDWVSEIQTYRTTRRFKGKEPVRKGEKTSVLRKVGASVHEIVAPRPHLEPLTMTEEVYLRIRESIGLRPAESGGMLGGSRETGLVTHYYFDTAAERSGGTYSPHVESINRQLSEIWDPAGIELLGFVHSHPHGFRRPSGGDLVYAERILGAIPALGQLLLPIVMTRPDTGIFELLPFAAVRDERRVRIVDLDLRRVPFVELPIPCTARISESVRIGQPADDRRDRSHGDESPTGGSWRPASSQEVPVAGVPVPREPAGEPVAVQAAEPPAAEPISVAPEAGPGEHPVEPPRPEARRAVDLPFETRKVGYADEPGSPVPFQDFAPKPGGVQAVSLEAAVGHEFDFAHLSSCRVVHVGTYLYPLVVELARCGVLEHIIIDPAQLVPADLALPHVDRWDFGQKRYRAQVLARQIRDINRHAGVKAELTRFDQLGDRDLAALIRGPFVRATGRREPAVSLLVGHCLGPMETATFNRLALALGVPSLRLQIEPDRREALVTFTAPGVTRNCHRCAGLQMPGDRVSGQTSAQAPLNHFDTMDLAAGLGRLSMALLHHGTGHPIWNLDSVGGMNTVSIRLKAHLDLTRRNVIQCQGAYLMENYLFDKVVRLGPTLTAQQVGLPKCQACGGEVYGAAKKAAAG